MDGFTVPVEAVETAGEAGVRLAGVVAAVPLARPLDDLAAALPGGRTAQTVQTAGSEWLASMKALVEQVTWQAAALVGAAGSYRDADSAAAAQLPGAPPRPR